MEATPYRALQRAKEGKIDEAIDMALKIPYPYWRIYALRDIAREIASKAPDKARQALQLAEQFLDELGDDYWRAIVSCLIGCDWATIGAVNKALANFEVAVQFADKLEDRHVKIGCLKELAVHMATRQGLDARIASKVRQTFNKAILHATTLDDKTAKAAFLRDIALELYRTGNSEQAASVILQAAEVARNIDDPQTKVSTLNSIVKEVAIALDQPTAEQVIEIAHQEALKIEDEWERSKALAELVDAISIGNDLTPVEVIAGEITESWWKQQAQKIVDDARQRAQQLDVETKPSEGIDGSPTLGNL